MQETYGFFPLCIISKQEANYFYSLGCSLSSIIAVYLLLVKALYFAGLGNILKVKITSRSVAKTPRISKMQRFATIVYALQPLTMVAKLSILNVCGGSGYVSDFLIYFKSCHQKFRKKTTLKIFAKFKSLICNFTKKETPANIFSYEFCGISKNVFFIEHLSVFLQFSHQSILNVEQFQQI